MRGGWSGDAQERGGEVGGRPVNDGGYLFSSLFLFVCFCFVVLLFCFNVVSLYLFTILFELVMHSEHIFICGMYAKLNFSIKRH